MHYARIFDSIRGRPAAGSFNVRLSMPAWVAVTPRELKQAHQSKTHIHREGGV